jgi:hypothetical protein
MTLERIVLVALVGAVLSDTNNPARNIKLPRVTEGEKSYGISVCIKACRYNVDENSWEVPRFATGKPCGLMV